MIDKDDLEPPTREEIFLRAIEIAEEIEDQLDLLATTLRRKARLADDSPQDYAERVRNYIPHILLLLLRNVHWMKDGLRDAHDSLTDPPPPEP